MTIKSRQISVSIIVAGMILLAPIDTTYLFASETASYPRLDGTLLIEIQNDALFDGESPDSELNDLYNTSEMALALHLNALFSLHTSLTFEPIRDAIDDRAFDDHGLYAEEAYLQLMPLSGLRIFAGKFNPAFGIAWDKGAGIYAVDFAEDYEITERLGLGAEISRDATPIGTLALSLGLYSLDTSELSNSIITRRGRTKVSDGGAGNTERLDSFNIALDGNQIPGLPGIEWHAAYRFHNKGRSSSDLHHEQGLAFGLHGLRELGNDIKFEWLAEYAFIDNVMGQSRDELHYYTLGSVMRFGRYNLAASFTGRPRQSEVDQDLDDKLLTLSAGLELYRGWSLDGAYKYHIEEDNENHTIGLLLARSLDFRR